MNETTQQADEQLIDSVAQLWLDKGGDAEGFSFVQNRILRRLRAMESTTNFVEMTPQGDGQA